MKNRAIICCHDLSERPLTLHGASPHDEVVLYTDEDEGFLDCVEQLGGADANIGAPGPGLWLWEGQIVTTETNTPDGSDFDTEFVGECRQLTLEELIMVGNGQNPLAPNRRAEIVAEIAKEREDRGCIEGYEP